MLSSSPCGEQATPRFQVEPDRVIAGASQRGSQPITRVGPLVQGDKEQPAVKSGGKKKPNPAPSSAGSLVDGQRR